MTFRVLLLNRIDPAGLAPFPSDRFEVGYDVLEPDAVLVRSANLHPFEFAESVKAVGRAGIGVDNIPVDVLSQRGIPVFNAPGANANAVKELVLAGMLLAARNIPAALHFVEHLEGDAVSIRQAVEAGKRQFAGFELPGRTLGVVGLGAIGVEVANAALALGMRVLGFDPAISVTRAWQLSSGVQQAGSLDALLIDSDMVTLHVPLTDDTRHMVDERRVGLMRNGAVLLNFAREHLVDTAAVAAALDGRIKAYVTDFPTAGLKGHPQVIALPHLGASTAEAEVNSAAMVAESVRMYLEEGTIRHSVNFPEVSLPAHRGDRLAIVNANVPGVVGAVSTTLASAGINIAELFNGSRGEHAYTLVDIDGHLPPEVLEAIHTLEGVRSARLVAG